MPMALALLLTAAPPQGQGATVVSIGDGDTLRVRRNGELIKVRLACIASARFCCMASRMAWPSRINCMLMACNRRRASPRSS